MTASQNTVPILISSYKNKIKKLFNHVSGRTSSKIEREIVFTQSKISELETKLNIIEKLTRDELYILEEERSYLSSEYILNALPKSKKKRILICGYYGARNCGDELMLQAILKNINTNKYDVTILLASNHNLDASYYYPYHVLHYPKKVEDCKFLAENYDAIVWVGGAVLDDTCYEYRGIHNDLAYILFTISLLMLQMKKDVYVLGVSANKTLQNKEAIKDLRFIVENATYFSLRDTNSRNTLKKAGIPTSNINIIDDLVLSLDFPVDPKKNYNNDIICIGVVLMSDRRDNPDTNTLIKNIITAGVDYYKNQKIHLELISFFDQYNFDYEMYDNALKNIDHELIKNVVLSIRKQDYSVSTISKVFSKCDIVISMRYHATLIAGGILNKRVLSINQGNTHRHYYNKQKYIKDKYINNLIEISYEDALNYKNFRKRLEKTAKTKPKGISRMEKNKIKGNIIAVIKKYLG